MLDEEQQQWWHDGRVKSEVPYQGVCFPSHNSATATTHECKPVFHNSPPLTHLEFTFDHWIVSISCQSCESPAKPCSRRPLCPCLPCLRVMPLMPQMVCQRHLSPVPHESPKVTMCKLVHILQIHTTSKSTPPGQPNHLTDGHTTPSFGTNDNNATDNDETTISPTPTPTAHLGGHKMVTYLRDQVWWRTMVQDVTDYCKSCQTYATSKSPTKRLCGLLKMMPVSTHLWQYIRIDFMGPLPKLSNQNGSYNTICVIIDLLTAMVHLVPTRQTYKVSDIAKVIFDMVYKLHGLPERIISNWDSLFTSHFWKKLYVLLNVELQLLSAFHPQTNGATKHVLMFSFQPVM